MSGFLIAEKASGVIIGGRSVKDNYSSSKLNSYVKRLQTIMDLALGACIVLERIHLLSGDYFPTENSFQKFFLEAIFRRKIVFREQMNSLLIYARS